MYLVQRGEGTDTVSAIVTAGGTVVSVTADKIRAVYTAWGGGGEVVLLLYVRLVRLL